jgi:Uma2 family endonuclease
VGTRTRSGAFGRLVRTKRSSLGVQAGTGSRIQVSPRRIRIPDVVLVPAGAQPEVLVDPPVLVVEVLSPDDTYSDTQERAQDYLEMGIKAVWLIDPKSGTGRMCIENAWVLAARLTVPDGPISCELETPSWPLSLR